jgi:hypothetical protein
MDTFFEENQKWIVGPGSSKKVAAIIMNRESAENVMRETDLAKKQGLNGDATMIENVEK